MTLRNSWGEGSLGNNLQLADHDAPVRAENNLQLSAVSTLIFYSSVQDTSGKGHDCGFDF